MQHPTPHSARGCSRSIRRIRLPVRPLFDERAGQCRLSVVYVTMGSYGPNRHSVPNRHATTGGSSWQLVPQRAAPLRTVPRAMSTPSCGGRPHHPPPSTCSPRPSRASTKHRPWKPPTNGSPRHIWPRCAPPPPSSPSAGRSGGHASRRRQRIRSAWEVLPEVAPELAEWSALFAAGAARRAKAEAGIAGAASRRDADDLLRDAAMFLRLVERMLLLQPSLPPQRAGYGRGTARGRQSEIPGRGGERGGVGREPGGQGERATPARLRPRPRHAPARPLRRPPGTRAAPGRRPVATRAAAAPGGPPPALSAPPDAPGTPTERRARSVRLRRRRTAWDGIGWWTPRRSCPRRGATRRV